jgi:hypothetical protein
LSTVNTSIGRDPACSIDDNWPMFLEAWPPLVRRAAEHGIRVGIENCPMQFPTFISDSTTPLAHNLAAHGRNPAHRRVWIPAASCSCKGRPDQPMQVGRYGDPAAGLPHAKASRSGRRALGRLLSQGPL